MIPFLSEIFETVVMLQPESIKLQVNMIIYMHFCYGLWYNESVVACLYTVLAFCYEDVAI